MASPEQHVTPPVVPVTEQYEAQESPWPFVIMALLVVCCLLSLLLLDIRIASLLCMAACAVLRFLSAPAEDGDNTSP